MVTLKPHPHSLNGQTTILLDLELTTGTVPLDGFAIELLFHTDAIEIADIYVVDEFATICTSVINECEKAQGCLYVTHNSLIPYKAGPSGKVVATICVRNKKQQETKFLVGERTQLFVHA